MFWTYRQRLNSGEIVRTNMKRLCGFAVSHIVMHYHAASHGVASSVVLSVALSVCHTSEPCKNSWNDQVSICILDSGGPNEPHITWGPDDNMGRNNFEGETGKSYRDTLRSSVQTRLNWSRCCFGCGLAWAQSIMCYMGGPHPRGKGQFWWIGAPIVKNRHFVP